MRCPKATAEVTRNCPITSPRRRARAASISSIWARMRRQWAWKSRPSSVRARCRVVRLTSRMPRRCSSRARRLLTTGRDMPSSRAAAVRLPTSATRAKTVISTRLSAMRITVLPLPGTGPQGAGWRFHSVTMQRPPGHPRCVPPLTHGLLRQGRGQGRARAGRKCSTLLPSRLVPSRDGDEAGKRGGFRPGCAAARAGGAAGMRDRAVSRGKGQDGWPKGAVSTACGWEAGC